MSVALNIVGLTAALAALYIIMVQVSHNLSFNRAVPDSDRIYLTTWGGSFTEDGDYGPFICRPMAEAIIAKTPGIEVGGHALFHDLFNADTECRIAPVNGTISLPVHFAELTTGGREVFGFELIAGNWDDMTDNSRYALSESTARRLGLGVGESFKLCGAYWGLAVNVATISVAAIYADPPRHSDLEKVDIFRNSDKDGLNQWSEWSSVYFVKLREGVTPEEAEQQMNAAMHDLPSNEFTEKVDSTDIVRLINLRDTYFSDVSASVLAQGSRTTTWTLLGIALLIVVIAFINYVNFFFAQIPFRLREVNTRKIFGCSRGRLVAPFVGESVLMVLIAIGFAVLFVVGFNASPLTRLIDVPLAFNLNILPAVVTVAVALLISVVASLYPALYITSFNPAFALKGTMGSVAKGRYFRTALIGFQFAVSTILIIAAVFIHRQHAFMLDKDMGFDRENILTVKTSWRIARAGNDLANVLRSDADIVDVAWGNGDFIADQRMTWEREVEGKYYHWQCYPVSWNFLRFMGIEIVEGRDFLSSDEQSESGVFIFNEAARDAFGLELGKSNVSGHVDAPAELAGICRNFNYSSLHNSIGPFSFYIMGKHPWLSPAQLFVRTAPGTDIATLSRRLCKTLCEFDSDLAPEDLDVRFLDAALQAQYERERNMSVLMTLFTLLAVVISLMGVFGLVMFETEHRRKEIGIRRVNGASVGEILAMFCGRFARIVAVCFVVALPFSIFVVERYLAGYPYRVDMAAWVFVAAMLAVLTVTVAVVAMRSWRAATDNPIEALKSE